MTPRRLDVDSLQRRLVDVQGLVDQLVDHDTEHLRRDPRDRAATLWLLTQLVSIAAGANAHVAAAELGRSPSTHRESFTLAVEAGVVDEALLPDLQAACGMRNVLVHEYGEIDLALVAAAIPQAREVFGAWAQDVARFLLDHGDAG